MIRLLCSHSVEFLFDIIEKYSFSEVIRLGIVQLGTTTLHLTKSVIDICIFESIAVPIEYPFKR